MHSDAVHLCKLFHCETVQCFKLQQTVGTKTADVTRMQCGRKRSLDVGVFSTSIHLRTLTRGKLSTYNVAIESFVALTFIPTPEKLVSERGGCFGCSESQTGGNWCN